MSNESERNLYELSVDDQSLFQDIRRKAWDRVSARLDDKEPIAETYLFRLFSEITKIQLQLEKAVGEKGPVAKEEEDILALIDSIGIPLPRKQQLLEQSIAVLSARGTDTTRHRAVLERLGARAELEQGEEDGPNEED